MGIERHNQFVLSRLRWGCLLVSWIFVCKGAWAVPRDTITVDGAVLQLDLELSEAGPRETVDGRGLSPWARPEMKVSVWTGGVRMLEGVQGQSLESVAGRSVRPCASAEISWTWTQEDRLLRLGLSAGVREVWTYDANTLDDSLYAVSGSDGGGLEQWIQNTYELGIELDTVPLLFDRRLAREGRAMLERGGKLGGRRGGEWTWWAGVHLFLVHLDRESVESERLPVVGRPDEGQILGRDRADWIPMTTLGWGLQVGVEHNLDGNWSWAVRGGWTSGLRSGVWCRAGLAHRLGR